MMRQFLDLKSKAAIEFVCPVCLKLPINPVKCQNIFCQGIFCFDCVKNLIGKSNVSAYQCPYRCSGERIFQIEDLNQFQLKYYDNFESICNFCNEKFSLLRFRKHNDKCEIKNNKDINITYSAQIKQQKLCQYCNEINIDDRYYCIKCNQQIKIQFSENCEAYQNDMQCEFCLQFFDRMSLNTHSTNLCLEYQVQCEICGISLLRKNYNDHSKLCIQKLKQILVQDQVYYDCIFKRLNLSIEQKQIEIKYNISKWVKIFKKIAKYKQQKTDDES
ncbi:TNF receptor-associated factor 5 [Paramecium bursaria]